MKLLPDHRWARAALGLPIGAGVGAVIFWADKLHGPGLYVLTGAAAGAVAGLAVQAYGGSLDLEDVTISIPQLSELHFIVTPDNRQAAWQLFIETTTRVSTQPLAADSGNLREALTSLYNLFQAVRSTLKEARPSRAGSRGPTVEELGVAMLNLELRPFLSYWHPLLREWEQAHDAPETSWEGNAQCRAALSDLQQRLNEYAEGYAKLAGLQSIETWVRASGEPEESQ
jgi:hypothetical protein